ncbi:MAG: hypothetical protein ACHQ1H_08430 [Nitrososphaerales archaeon]
MNEPSRKQILAEIFAVLILSFAAIIIQNSIVQIPLLVINAILLISLVAYGLDFLERKTRKTLHMNAV